MSIRLLLAATAVPAGVALLFPAAPAFAQSLVSQPALPLLNGAPASPAPAIPPLVVPAAGSTASSQPRTTPAAPLPTAQNPAASAPVSPGLPPIAFSAQPATPPPAAPVPSAALPPVGQPAGPPRTASRGSAILLDQANYWSAQGRPELAQQALERLLLVEPNNPDVLATAAEVSAQNGERAQAEAYVARLNQLAPGTPAATRGAASLRIATVDQAALSEARRLAQAGQREAAVQRYRDLFPNGEVPDVYAAEYYQTLASISLQSFLEARAATEAVLARSPENRPLQLAYATMLTTRETTRPEGIERLRALSRSPDVAGSARAAWRQALLWQGPSGETFTQIEEYLQVYPTDPEMAEKLEEARTSVQDPMAATRMQAYEVLSTNQREAERLFEQAIAANPDDVDAIVGLGLIRRSQRREAEAKQLLDRATALVPDRRDDFLRTMGYVSPEGVPYPEVGSYASGRGGRGAAGAATAGLRGGRGSSGTGTGPSVEAWRALQRGDLNRAESLGQRLARGTAAEQADAANLLGQIALRRRDYGTAELRFRESLSRRPNQTDVQASLYGALVQLGRFDDADRFAQQSGFRPTTGTDGLRSDALRNRAQREADADQRIALLRSALAAQPDSIWAAHDLARLLKARGQQAEARRLEGELVRRGSTDALYASALLSEYDGRVAETVSRLSAISPAARNPDINTMLERNRRSLEVLRLEVAARGNPSSPAAQRLVALAAQPDESGATQAAVLRAFGRLRQSDNLEAARRAANPEGPATPGPAKAAIAAALLDAGREQAADGVAQRAERDPRLAEDVRRTVAASVRPASVAGTLPTTSTENPQNWRAQLSLARVYAGSGRGPEATELAEAVLRQNPDNVEARSVAGEVAVVRGQTARAEQLLSEGRARRADELQMALLEARIARSRDDQVRARRALEAAARLRGEQLRAANP
ncbi:tetratricopeptide repeat protein [Roseomonas sp. WA12]